MAKIYDNPADYYAEREEDRLALDLSSLYCPHCGCNAVQILRAPNPSGWMSRTGLGKCAACRREFGINVEKEVAEPPTEDPLGGGTEYLY